MITASSCAPESTSSSSRRRRATRSAAAEREVSRRIGRLRALASSIHLEVVPEVFELGPASALLAAEPDLAEGLPVRGAPFVVHGGLAVPADDPHARLGPRPDGAD